MTRTLSKPFLVGPKTPPALSVCVDHSDARNLIDGFRRNIEFVHTEDSTRSFLWVIQAVTLGGDMRHTPSLINIVRDLLTCLIRKPKYEEEQAIDIMELGSAMAHSIRYVSSAQPSRKTNT